MKAFLGRAGALIIALLFLVLSVATSILVIVQSRQQSNKDAAATQTQPKEGQLQGTQLSNFTPVTKIDKLQTTDTNVGSGDIVKPNDTVTVNYTGAIASTGVIFQSSLDSGQPIAFPLNQVIKGWTEGIPGMKVGGTRRLLIPASLAYGDSPPQGSGIPANADLVFDVTLVKIGQ